MFDDVVNIIIWSKIYTVHKKKKSLKSLWTILVDNN